MPPPNYSILLAIVRTKYCCTLRGVRAMQAAIGRCLGRYLAHTIKKTNKLLICRLVEQTIVQTLPGSTREKSFHPWSHKASQHAGPAAQKRNTPRFALISLRLLMI